jgi:cholesterol oxidase
VTNAAGVSQRTSTYRSWAFVGSEDGSNTTLDVTYVPLALAHGAELRPFCEVVAVGAVDGGYQVRYVDHGTGAEHTEHAPRLILAAGCLNTLRLLFAARDRDRTLPGLSKMLGRRFSVNGDRLSLVWRSRILQDSSWGPPISAVSNVSRHGRHRFAVGAVGLPVHAMPVPPALASRLRNSTFVFTMGRDAPAGTLGFDGRGVITSATRSLDPDLYDEMEDAAARIAEHYSAQRVLPRRRAGREGLVAVHPMGGCAMARSAEEGVVDHRGEVFGYPGLYVADGSLYPRSPGVAPSMTIAALAERQAELIAA